MEERVSFMSPVIHNIMPQRKERYDFSFVYEYASMDFSMAIPMLRPQWQSLYYPLSSLVWASVLIFLLVTPFILTLVRLSDLRVTFLAVIGYARFKHLTFASV